MSLKNTAQLYHSQQLRFYKLFGALVFLILIISTLGIFIGPASMTLESVSDFIHGRSELLSRLVWDIRFPRVVLGLIAGGALAVSGCALQSLFNNPLADTGLIGISSGAMIGVIIGILFGKVFAPLTYLLEHYSESYLSILAFLGAMGLGFLVYRLSLNKGRVQVGIMLLAGVAVNAFAGAFTGLMINMANDEQLRTITFWSLGSLNGASWKINTILGVISLLGTALIIRRAKELDALGLGEREAIYLGVDTLKVKKEVLILSALLCGPVISFVGLIGFVGLVVPHILRIFIGPKNGPLMICSYLLGGVFLILSDILAKVVIMPSELPIGVITALIGTPFFTFLLLKQKKRVGLD